MSDLRQYAPATERNRQPILEVISQFLPKTGNILEISSGTGEHAVFFAPRLAPCRWIPSDCNPLALDSIQSWCDYCPSPNLDRPLFIDVHQPIWAVETDNIPINAIVNINMIHISPWSACLALMAGASRILGQGGILYLYGPYKQQGHHTAVSNETFDFSLRAQNPAWGVRNLEDVVQEARNRGLQLLEVIPMPANNLSVVFQIIY
jgi:Protein of unknown function (DUF938)